MRGGRGRRKGRSLQIPLVAAQGPARAWRSDYNAGAEIHGAHRRLASFPRLSAVVDDPAGLLSLLKLVECTILREVVLCRRLERGPRKRLFVALLLCGVLGASLSAGADNLRHAGAAAAATLAGDLPAAPVEGQPADIAPFAYAYRKGAANNPMETRWLNPKPDMLCGLLWEERRCVRRIEVEFPSPPAHGSQRQQLRLVTRTAAAPFEEASVPGFGLGPQQEFTLKPVARSGRDAAGHDASSPSRPRTTSTASRCSTPATMPRSASPWCGPSAARRGRNR